VWDAFRSAMRELGYVDGRTVRFEPRGADGNSERLAALAEELVRLKVDVIVASGSRAVQVGRQATATIPIVMASSGDPVGLGFVASLARPGGNVTGVSTQIGDLSAKRVELARELVPGASRLAILEDAGAIGIVARKTQAVAQALGVRLHAVSVRSPAELEGAFSTIVRKRPQVLIVSPSQVFFAERRRLAELAVTHRLPTVHASREYVEAGGLIAYGSAVTGFFRRAAGYVDKILRGAKPADLPVEQPTTFELVINVSEWAT
jgi:putative ABC transport system substrate-binding protein